MSFIDKIKSGVTEAGQKAKVVVEVNKLKLVNVGKQNEINSLYKKIGEKVFQLSENKDSLSEVQFSEEIEAIHILKIEIEQNLQQIQNLSDEKYCPACGAGNAITARECTSCQTVFTVHEMKEAEQKDQYIELTPTDSEKTTSE